MKISPIRNWIKIIAAGALLLTASAAMAGIIFIPVGGRYIAPESAPVNIQHLGGETFRIQTSGLSGEWIIDASDFPPESGLPAAAQVVLPFSQDLELVIDLASGTVTGSSISASPDMSSPVLFNSIHGHAYCVPRNGLECGQLVVDLEASGAITDPNDPASVGLLRMGMLGSLVWGGASGGGIWGGGAGSGIWAAMSAHAGLAGTMSINGSQGSGTLIGP